MISTEIRIFRAIANLQHEHIIPLRSVQMADPYIIIVMERADQNLADFAANYRKQHEGNVPPEIAVGLIEQVALALDFLSESRFPEISPVRGLQHCDIKPTNILLVGDVVKVADFGLSAWAGWKTHSSGWRGTFPYAAPEVFRGSATRGTDQYALAMTYCELVMGDRPFLRDDAGKQPPPNGYTVDLAQFRVEETPIFARALHPDPSNRYQSCMAFVEGLKRALRSQRNLSITPPPSTFRKNLP
ncbi:MAG: serine/threonine protein kinase [Gemmataceae bacterium]